MYKTMELNEIIAQRKAKFESLKGKLADLSHNQAFKGAIPIRQALDNLQEDKEVNLCGRVMARRSHGKASFIDLRDSTAKIQLYLKSDIVGEDKFQALEDIDIADIINVRGRLFMTQTREPTVKVEDFSALSKALRPL